MEEERQAREISEMYSVVFAHPQVEAITTWDVNDGCWLKAPSGFVREDNSKKPSYDALMNLIHGEWETHLTLMTDAEGYFSFTGFKGNYSVCSDAGAASLTLKDEFAGTLKLN